MLLLFLSIQAQDFIEDPLGLRGGGIVHHS